MSVYRFFGTSGHILVSQWHFGRPCDVFLALWVTLGLRFVILGAPLWHPGVHFVTLGEHLGGFLWIWNDLGAPWWYLWAPLGHPWGTLAHFLEKGIKKVTNGLPTGPPNGTVFGAFSIFLLFCCGCYGGSLEDTCFWVFFLRCFLGFREAEYGFDHSFYCAKRTSHIWEQTQLF